MAQGFSYFSEVRARGLLNLGNHQNWENLLRIKNYMRYKAVTDFALIALHKTNENFHKLFYENFHGSVTLLHVFFIGFS